MISARRHPFLRVLFFALSIWPAFVFARCGPDIPEVLRKMEASYRAVTNYQARVEVRVYRRDGSYSARKFLYTFKKPNLVRLDFVTPYPGMVLVYPDSEGKVVLRPPGWARFFKFRLAPDDPLLTVSAGQRIDQTDMGLLIGNIAGSVTAERRGPIEVSEDRNGIRVRVLAEDHFREGVVTLYLFLIDRKLRLPVEVRESNRKGGLERAVFFRDIRTNINLPDKTFQVEDR
jgi:hypothetical protein